MMNLRCAIHTFVFFLWRQTLVRGLFWKWSIVKWKALHWLDSGRTVCVIPVSKTHVSGNTWRHDMRFFTMMFGQFGRIFRIFQLRNPKGLVPTLCEDGMPPVYESAVCVEYIDELARDRSGGNLNRTLMPGSPAERAALRLKVDWINKRLWWSSTVCFETSSYSQVHLVSLCRF